MAVIARERQELNLSIQDTICDARWNYRGNVKVGNIATWSTLASDREFQTQYGPVCGTCTGCCGACGKAKEGKKRPPCYVFKSYRYSNIIDGHARNTLSIRNNPELAFRQLSDSLSRKRIPIVAGRFDQSGEIENSIQFAGMCMIAREHAKTPFYVYTKRYDVVIPALLAGLVPKNLTVLISIWHEIGIKEYLKVAHLPNVKAFVYCDYNSDPVNGWGVEEYAERGVYIQTFCKAYDESGKMNHNITCEKCKKCFNRSLKAKVVGCLDH